MSWSKIALIIIGIPLIYVIGCILYAKITYFNPPSEQILYENAAAQTIDSTS